MPSTRLVPEIAAEASGLPPLRTRLHAGMSYVLFVNAENSFFHSLLHVDTTLRRRIPLTAFPAATEMIT